MNDPIIRQYAHAELDEKASRAFEARLEAEPELRETLDIYLALQAREAVASKQRWQKLQAEHSTIEKKQIRPLWQKPATWLALAAGMLALMAITWSLNQSGPDARDLTNNYLAQGYPAPEIAMGRTDQDSLWALASAAYREGKYNKAENLIDQIDIVTNEQMFYLGLSLMYKEPADYQRAILTLKQTGGNYQEAAIYYQALAHIQSDQLATAKSLLQQIREGGRRQEVESLLKALEP